MSILMDMGWAFLFSFLGGITGMFLIGCAAGYLPKIIDKLTPEIDETKEILRGNMAVAHYFGRLMSASILGVSIVIAAAILGGIMAALH